METFIDQIINALPEAIATSVVTVLFSGITIFLLQKQIEHLLAKSLHAYQTKFSRNYQKRAETFAAIYEKYMLFASILNELNPEAQIRREDELGAEDYLKKHEDAKSALKDFWRYFEFNRVYLPDASYARIAKIYENAVTLQDALMSLHRSRKDHEPIAADLKDSLQNILPRTPGASLDVLQTPEQLMRWIRLLLEFERLGLEDLYKSHADEKTI